MLKVSVWAFVCQQIQSVVTTERMSKLHYITAELCLSLTAVNDKRWSKGIARYVYVHGHKKMCDGGNG